MPTFVQVFPPLVVAFLVITLVVAALRKPAAPRGGQNQPVQFPQQSTPADPAFPPLSQATPAKGDDRDSL